MILPTAYGATSETIVDGTITAADIADGVVPTSVRRGALFTGETGNYAIATWAPTVAGRAVHEFTISVNGAADEDFLGVNSALRPAYKRLSASRDVEVRNISGVLLTIPDALPTDGTPTTFRVVYEVDSVTAFVNGVEVASSTPTFTYNETVIVSHIIGGISAGSSTKLNGTLHDVSFIDPADDTNTAYFPLDGLDSSGNFPNEHPGSTVADATVTGLVQFASVLSADGGRALPVAFPVLITGERNAAVGSGSTLSYGGGALNTANGIILTHPARLAGLSFRGVATGTGTATLAIRQNGVNVATVTATAAASAYTATETAAFDAGDRVDFIVSAHTSGFASGITASALLFLEL